MIRRNDEGLASPNKRPRISSGISLLERDRHIRRREAIRNALASSSDSGKHGLTMSTTLLPQSPSHPNFPEDQLVDQMPGEEEYAQIWTPSSSAALFVPASQLPAASRTPGRRLEQGWCQPSQQTIAKASHLLEQWQDDAEQGYVPLRPSQSTAPSTPARSALAALDNLPGNDLVTKVPTRSKLPLDAPPPFRPPAMKKLGSQSTPAARRSNPSPKSSTTLKSSSLLKTALTRRPAAPLRLSSIGRPFSTPRAKSSSLAAVSPSLTSSLATHDQVKSSPSAKPDASTHRYQFFDLSKRLKRLSMEACGVKPGSQTVALLMKHGIPLELPNVNMSNARYYRFLSPKVSVGDSQITTSSEEYQGVEDALIELQRGKCKHATKQWVENHWDLVLWKLASLVCACPSLFDGDPIITPDGGKWSYHEVINQLLYRYEREFVLGHRSSLRLMTERDTDSRRSMIVCVSDLLWSNNTIPVLDRKGQPVLDHQGRPLTTEARPTLEITDGWYRLRAEIDAPLERAVRRQKIKIGTKIAISGAKLQGPPKDINPLQAYKSMTLSICGNSTSLARWDSKLGFFSQNAHPSSFVACLRSLTPDGGIVTLVDVVIVKLFPEGYLEAENSDVLTEDARQSLTLRSKEEDDQEHELWLRRRMKEEGKLREIHARKLYTLQGIVEELQSAAQGCETVGEDYASDFIDEVADELMEADDIKTHSETSFRRAKAKLSPHGCRFLAQTLRQRCAHLCEKGNELVQRDLETLCPPREVRRFRVVRFKDARSTGRRPSVREGELTVWDSQAVDDMLSEGRRFLISNIVPSNPKAWQGPDAQGQAYFKTRKDTRWIPMTSGSD